MLGSGMRVANSPVMSRSIVLIALAACEGGQTPTETATVSALREPCVGFISQLCLVVTDEGEQPHREFFGVQGYAHRWGVESEIVYTREPLDPPPADGPSETLILLDIVVEREPITAPFQLAFPAGGTGWFSDTTPLEMDGTRIECDAAICDQLTAADTSETPFTATFELTDNPQILRATAVSL